MCGLILLVAAAIHFFGVETLPGKNGVKLRS
jgi:hypothetical protein